MTILNYEYHIDVENVHDALYRFGTFAGTCGWTVEHLYEDCGDWSSTTGFDSGDQTFLMCSTDGSFNGNNPDQVCRFQLWTEHRTGGDSGDQGTILVRGRLPDETTEILGLSTHPIWQYDWGPDDTDASRHYMKGTAPPNVWFFGNERFLAFHYDNDGVRNSQFQIGTPKLFDITQSTPDGAFIHQSYLNTNRLEWDSDTYQTYAGICGVNVSSSYPNFRINSGTYYYNRWRMNPAPDVLSNTVSYEMINVNNSTYCVGPMTGNIFYTTSNLDGYALPYANARLILKPTIFVYNTTYAWWIPYGEMDAYMGYVVGLDSGAIFEHGTKQFMGFPGFNRKKFGWCYRIA